MPTNLREVLACELAHGPRLYVVLVRREGRRFTLLGTLRGHQAALVRHPPALERLSERLRLPVKLLDGHAATFLSTEVLLNHRYGGKAFVL